MLGCVKKAISSVKWVKTVYGVYIAMQVAGPL